MLCQDTTHGVVTRRVHTPAPRASVTSGLATASVHQACLVTPAISRVPRTRGGFTAPTTAAVSGSLLTDATLRSVCVLVQFAAGETCFVDFCM